MHLVHLGCIITDNPKDLKTMNMEVDPMTIQEAIRLFNNYLHSRFESVYAERDLDSIGPDDIYTFLESQTHNLAKTTRRLRYAQMKAFYNFIIDRCSLNMKNPCNTSLLRKSYRTPKQVMRKMLERETVDEMIYNTKRVRDRLILELQARCGLRIGELLKIKVSDISD
jgi:integrase/recombinase XerD